MADNYNGVGGSFTIDSVTGDVKATMPVAEEKEITYSSNNKEKSKGVSNDGAVN